MLGNHVEQAGSYVDDKRCRFDFNHFAALTGEELRAVEDIVNRHILASESVDTAVMPFEEAKKLGAMALFGEKYGETVRVVTIPGYSTGAVRRHSYHQHGNGRTFQDRFGIIGGRRSAPYRSRDRCKCT